MDDASSEIYYAQVVAEGSTRTVAPATGEQRRAVLDASASFTF